MQKMSGAGEDRRFMLAGFVGLLGAILVGAGEFTLQFTPDGGYEAAGYPYFSAISKGRLSVGHFMSVLAAPLYLAGYWHLGKAFSLGGSPLAGRTITLIGGYAFVIGNAWLGGRVYLALLVHKIAETADPGMQTLLSGLLEAFSQHNEPLVNVLRVAMLLISAAWVVCILKSNTLYPRWMAVFSPIAILASIFALYFTWPAVGVWLLPSAMNVTHVIVFALSLIVLHHKPYRISSHAGSRQVQD